MPNVTTFPQPAGILLYSPSASQSYFIPNMTFNSFGVQQTPSILSSIPVAQVITLVASQIPSYSGSEKEDVEIWIRKIEKVAEIHGVNEAIKLMAATNKLTKDARDWYDQNTGILSVSWSLFKEAMVKQFHDRIPHAKAIQKVEARRWNFPKESFQEYVMQKLKLLHPLQLSQSDNINYIVRGINNAAIRSAAAVTGATTIHDFVDKMRNVTSAYSAPTTHHNKVKLFTHKELHTCTHVFVKVEGKKSLEPPYEGTTI